MKRLRKDFFEKPTLTLAKELLGKILCVRKIKGIIVETEAYLPNDSASHSFNGLSKRNTAMFEKQGLLYVYQIYGIHNCVNITSERKGIGAAVLIRSVLPLSSSIELIQKRRGVKICKKNLTNGPGKLCQGLDIRITDNFTDLTKSKEIFLLDNNLKCKIISKPRIGISKNKDKLWRFIARDLEKLTKRENF